MNDTAATPPRPSRAGLGLFFPGTFYGWTIVAATTVIGGMTMAMAGFNFGLFIKPMGEDLGISRETFGWAISLRSVAGGLTSLWVGRLIDRRGARLLLFVATSVTCAAMVGLSFVERGWQLVALFIAMGLLGMVGPGALAVSAPVAKWFVIKRGRAMAIMSLGTPAGAVVMVPLTEFFIGQYGWERAWIILAVLCAAIVLPLTLLVRRQPEDMGLLPDGVTHSAEESRAAAAALQEESWTVHDAIRTGTYWRLVVVFSLVMLGMSSVGLHRIPHFTDQGISAKWVSIATAADALAAVACTFAMGNLVQRFPARLLGAGGFLVLAFAVMLTILADSVPMMFVAMITFGLGAGSQILLQNFLWADYFGRAKVASIRGAAMPVMLIFSALGAPFAGRVVDSTGSYDPAWYTGIALMLAGALVLFVTPPPRRRSPAGGAVTVDGAVAAAS
jgi:predicted MFS family arabinose efflux permease